MLPPLPISSSFPSPSRRRACLDFCGEIVVKINSGGMKWRTPALNDSELLRCEGIGERGPPELLALLRAGPDLGAFQARTTVTPGCCSRVCFLAAK